MADVILRARSYLTRVQSQIRDQQDPDRPTAADVEAMADALDRLEDLLGPPVEEPNHG